MRKFLLFIFISLIMLSPLESYAVEQDETKKCRVSGMTLQWQLDHCFIGQQSDDEQYPTVRACMDLFPLWQDSENCEQNEKFKRYRCSYLKDSLLMGDSVFSGSMDECLDSKDTVGSTVKKGGVGG